MGKRSYNSGDNEYEVISKKMKKLQRQLLRARRKDPERSRSQRRRSSSTSSSSSGQSSPDRSEALYEPRPSTSTAAVDTLPPRTQTTSTTVPMPPLTHPTAPPASLTPPTHQAPTEHLTSTNQIEPVDEITEAPAAPELSDDILQLLGEDPSQSKSYGKDIQPDLAVRIQHIATKGLSKEARKELMDKYLPPGNCTLIDAHSLNLEIKAAISEAVLKRNKGIEQKQKQISSTISCLAEALSLLLSSEPTNTIVIKLLMDAIKLLSDSQYSDSLIRRNFVLYNLKKDLKDQIQNTNIDKFLFSQDLADTLKAAKAISKSGADLKMTVAKTAPKKTNTPPQKNYNWRAPPQNYRPKGHQRTTKEPAYKNRHVNSSKQSSRPASSHNRR
ncbi:hypothetical protein ABMA27_015551 [Loxostege sticticalis]|uniref:Uncharacterized protein n=1 Tax=Loxostege sticticalis TaxID=481309 RepID=A0ABR3I849_LOXSC